MFRICLKRKIYVIIFLMGVAVHLLYLAFLFNGAPIDRLNWSHEDTPSYVHPARTFVERGTFEHNNVPDYYRTIGYPTFLAGVFYISDRSGLDWRLLAFLAQAVLFAFAYPAIYYIGCQTFGLQPWAGLCCVAFTMLSGAFVSYVPVILSDALFATMFIAGVACGFFALNRLSFFWGLIHVILITFAANIRPMLALFPLSGACMHWVYAKQNQRSFPRAAYLLIGFMFFLALLGTQTAALKNFYYHRIFTPTEIGSINLFDYVAQDILRMRGEYQRIEETLEALNELSANRNVAQRISIRKEKAFQVFLEYPFETIGMLVYNSVLNALETHWQNLFYLFKKTWYKGYGAGPIVWKPIPFLIALVFVGVYGIVYFASFLQIFLTKRNLLLYLSVFLFIAPYAFCATSFQGARFRLWLEPFITMSAFATIQIFISALPHKGQNPDQDFKKQ
jgi:hypothetical protein